MDASVPEFDMVAVSFDTLKFTHRLEKAGLPREQAEAQAEALAEAFEVNLGDLVTKADLKGYESTIRADLEKIETKLIGESIDLRKDMELRFAQADAKTETRFIKIEGDLVLVKWMLGVVIGGVVALVGKAFF